MREKQYCHFCGNRLARMHVEGRERFFCQSCQLPIYENPVPATCTVVQDNAGKILLVKRSVAPEIGGWCLPGGYIEIGEAPDASALRELTEETGLAGTIDRLLGVMKGNSDIYHTLLMVGYRVLSFTGELVAGDDAADARFFPAREMPPVVFRTHRRFIEMATAPDTGASHPGR